ncbi:TraR/DksA C4-type zinc finger protein [Cellulomonas sp. C5510]|uniref:TraR/DksA family transcriptional regulator n=1 Tax=Cellulomonas sp. C5510 TaxID=2871170 RepID=UPI001C985B22|nr:TraR/DksA C4-type zinc finger protein [Cellulomonas sp. C5510]QZN85877.1 TraR/DksA C4-type zinc finger protein [Cellulomonas sp. C5510]
MAETLDRDEVAAVLRERRREAVARLAGTGAEREAVVAAARESVTDDEHDPEGSTIAYERRMLDALTHDMRERIAEVDAALDRLDRGTYGTCERCGQPIPVERLRALPAARTCVACASR